MKAKLIIGIVLIFLLPTQSMSSTETIKLKIPIVDAHSEYYSNLLETALTNAGYRTEIEEIELPSRRAQRYIESGDIDIIVMIRDEERDSKLIPIPIGLTNGLIASRVLFIPEGDSYIYKEVNSLKEFQELNKTVGMGAQWFDVDVWEANNLSVYKHTNDYTQIFHMVANKSRGIDYYSTGFNEALNELETFSSLGLEIEPRLMLIYERDYIFYMSAEAASKYKAQIETALKLANNSGLINRMVREYWAEAFNKLDYDGRVKIHLYTPE